ncbi:hypothetical protein BX600DRAFT_517916 [Xylariales sp. PMI_506]|nr:hypothetical protein BX600DRAFT_517916 [Xylariales sp. PMI_506]
MQSQSSGSPQRFCWECLRRRIVCDSTQPVCKKCENAGIVCPGYDDKKPLKWMTPDTGLNRPKHKRRQSSSPKSRSGHEERADERPSASSSSSTQTPQVQAPRDVGESEVADLFADIELQDNTSDIIQAISYCKFPPTPNP